MIVSNVFLVIILIDNYMVFACDFTAGYWVLDIEYC